MKKTIFLIISSNDHPIYNLMKTITTLYMKKMSQIYPIQYFFIYLDENINDSLVLDDHTIYVKGEESLIPGIFIKTYNSINYINNNFEYDYIIRTNLSTFWNIPHFYELDLNTNKLATGFLIFSNFLSGTGIILSKDVAVEFIKNIKNIKNINKISDDVLISNTIKHIIPLSHLDDKKMCYLINGKNNIIPEEFNNILYFRIKSEGDRHHDGIAFIKLAKLLYNIDYENV
jgi:hypothetical protein